jgi:hypothetical protein
MKFITASRGQKFTRVFCVFIPHLKLAVMTATSMQFSDQLELDINRRLIWNLFALLIAINAGGFSGSTQHKLEV